MSEDWTNIQIMECEDLSGAIVTVFAQSDGEHRRYVFGNGHPLEVNRDGTFTIPESQAVLSVMSI
ncbi:MHC class I heavy chain [Salipiger bermudensis]|uniref:MHC class I heavy chain n=1 Tax=Salipiger bermudensis TaxID=344736 RepID=UPI001CD5A3F5|nr:MHC class I heavy chain [Salipiger bermudensis]MCA1288050.1 MHC class I heavy chain [Salipiger bermudensis]